MSSETNIRESENITLAEPCTIKHVDEKFKSFSDTELYKNKEQVEEIIITKANPQYSSDRGNTRPRTYYNEQVAGRPVYVQQVHAFV